MKLIGAVSKRIEELCYQRDLTVHGLSIKSGIPNSTLVAVIKKKYDSVQLKVIFSICDGLNLSLEEFFRSPLFECVNLTD